MAGVYGVMAYTVEQRSREIGVRMALGADKATVMRLILGQGVVLALAGLVLGLAGAVAATRLLETVLFEVRPIDVQVYLGVSADSVRHAARRLHSSLARGHFESSGCPQSGVGIDEIRWPFISQKRDEEMSDEMAFHIESKTRELVDAGMSEADARLEARRRFGSVLKQKEAGHEIKAGRSSKT